MLTHASALLQPWALACLPAEAAHVPRCCRPAGEVGGAPPSKSLLYITLLPLQHPVHCSPPCI